MIPAPCHRLPAGEGGDAQEVELELRHLGAVLRREGNPFRLSDVTCNE